MSTKIYTIGFTQKTAETFFTLLESNGIERLIDVRLNNTSQLAAFAKKDDLSFFLNRIAGIKYQHEPMLAPTKEIRDTLKQKDQGWDEYVRRFTALMAERDILNHLDRESFSQHPTCLLCSEATADECHRRLVAEHLASSWPELTIKHL